MTFQGVILLLNLLTKHFSIGGYVKAKPNQVVTLSEVNDLKLQIADLSKKLSELKSTTETEYSRISDFSSKSISIQGNTIMIFTLLFAIFAFFFASNLNKTAEKIYQSNQDAQKKLEEIEKMKLEVNESKGETLKLLQTINEEPKRIFNVIKKQQIEYAFTRLEINPEDISNFFSEFATIDSLDEKYFDLLVKLYFKTVKKTEDETEKTGDLAYIILSIQHFPDKVIQSSDLISIISEDFKDIYSILHLIDKIRYLKALNIYSSLIYIKDHYLKFVQFVYIFKDFSPEIMVELKKVPREWVASLQDKDFREFLERNNTI
jgi:hypothetical protein